MAFYLGNQKIGSVLTEYTTTVMDTSDATATERDIINGKIAYAGGKKITGTIPEKEAATYVPTTEDQIINADQYISGDQTILGDPNLLAKHIRKGVTIFGITGILADGVIADEYWGDGSDGDLTVTAGSTYNEPVTLDEGQIVKQYNNLTIEEGGIWQPENRCNGAVIMVSGDLTVNGTLSMDKCAPLLNEQEAICAEQKHVRLCCINANISAGGSGGTGGKGVSNSSYTNRNGAAGKGGTGFIFGGGFGGGGGAAGYTHNSSTYALTATAAAAGDPRPPIGTTIPYPADTSTTQYYGVGGRINAVYSSTTNRYYGGDGPGGGGAIGYWSSANSSAVPTYKAAGYAGDALGGGAIWLFVKGKITVGATGLISANGGSGGAGRKYSSQPVASGGGGGGGGGIICIIHNGEYTVEEGGSVVANGGSGGAAATSSYVTGNAGSDGDAGTVYITSWDELFPNELG